MFWILSEILMLIFMGISFTLFCNRYSSLLVYFLVQLFSRFNVLLFYLFPNTFLFTSSLLLKFGFFPFHSWFISSSYRFPNFILFLSATLHKLPFFFALYLFSMPTNYVMLLVTGILTTILIGLTALSSVDTRLLLVLSSVANNTWLLLASFSLISLLFYSVFYSLSVLFTLMSMHSFTKVPFNSVPLLVNLSGLPPLPIFLPKMFIVCSLSIHDSRLMSSLVIIFLVLNVPIIAAYISHSASLVIFNQVSLPSLCLKL